MSGGERVYRGVVKGFSVVFLLIGSAVLAMTLANGGSPTSVGFVMGIAFVGIGVGRLWAASRMGG